jgi:hypothetical protein
MRLQIFVLAAALALAAGCDKRPDPQKPAASADKAPPSQPQVNTPSTPAPSSATGGASAASQEEKKEGANPQQGQVDPKDSDQHRDFQQKGDAAGPKSPDTAPKQGN